MNHPNLYQLRETYNREKILLCFNGPFSQGLIEEIGNAVKRYMESEAVSSSSARDVFAVYIEIAQNIRQYTSDRGYTDGDASATVVIGRDPEGRYYVLAGNIVELEDGRALTQQIDALSKLDKAELRAAYKEQLRKPRDETRSAAGLGLIDMARKATLPISSLLHADGNGGRMFFSLRVVI